MRILFVVLLSMFVNAKQNDFDDLGRDKTGIVAIHKKLMGLKDKIKANLALSRKDMESLEERLKLLKMKHIDQVHSMGDSIDEVNKKTSIGQYLFQADIVLTRRQADEIMSDIRSYGKGRSKRQAFRDEDYPNTIWKNNRVAFFFDGSASETVRRVFRKAAFAWRESTCVDLYEDTCAASRDRIRVVTKKGCWSYVGRIGGEQPLSLGPGCESIRNAAHELGHALGLFHSHQRHDRDQFVTIDIRNIKESRLVNFVQETSSTNHNYDVPYDVGSIMQYGSTLSALYMRSGSANNNRTMVPIDILHVETLGSHIISFTDFLVLNRHYNCTDRCKPGQSAVCENGGIPHPRNCRKCICPGGYGGTLCSQRPSGCGEELVADESAKIFRNTVGNKMYGNTTREDFDKCHYWIRAPKGKRIEVTLLKFSLENIAVDGCKYGGVEIKTQPDQRLTGYRFCSLNDLNTTLVSNQTIVPIITFNRQYQLDTEIQYRCLD